MLAINGGPVCQIGGSTDKKGNQIQIIGFTGQNAKIPFKRLYDKISSQ